MGSRSQGYFHCCVIVTLREHTVALVSILPWTFGVSPVWDYHRFLYVSMGTRVCVRGAHT